MALYSQTRINSVSCCTFGFCYGHRVVRNGSASDEPEVLEDVGESWITRHFRLIRTMPKELEIEVAEMIRADAENAPMALQELSSEGVRAVVEYIINKLEATGIDPRAEYEDLNDDDDEYDDLDDDFDDDDDDRWPGDSDDDNDDE